MAATSNTRTGGRGEGGRTRVQTSTASSITRQEVPRPVLHLRGMETGGGGGGVVGPSGASLIPGQRGEGGEMITTPGGTVRRIQWADNVVDNEGMGRKKSKVCCIYHPPRPIDESSDDSSSDSESDEDNDSGNDDGAARPSGSGGAGAGKERDCDHDHGSGKGKGKARKKCPNAYERQPKPKDGGSKVNKG